MSCYVTCMESDIFIHKENIPLAMKALEEKFPKLFPPHLPKLSFAEFSHSLFGFQVDHDTEGNVDGIYFEYGKWGDNDDFFQAIAPYVRAGSTFCGKADDDSMWCTYFDGQDCTDHSGYVVYPTLPQVRHDDDGPGVDRSMFPYLIRGYLGTVFDKDFANSIPGVTVMHMAELAAQTRQPPYRIPDARYGVTMFMQEILAQKINVEPEDLTKLLEEQQ